jgi:hypothetical protein
LLSIFYPHHAIPSQSFVIGPGNCLQSHPSSVLFNQSTNLLSPSIHPFNLIPTRNGLHETTRDPRARPPRWMVSDKKPKVLPGRHTVLSEDLNACIRICQLWHRTLIPLLWMIFDSEAATARKIPTSVIHYPEIQNTAIIFETPYSDPNSPSQYSTLLVSANSASPPWNSWRLFA